MSDTDEIMNKISEWTGKMIVRCMSETEPDEADNVADVLFTDDNIPLLVALSGGVLEAIRTAFVMGHHWTQDMESDESGLSDLLKDVKGL